MTTHAKDGMKLSNKHKGIILAFENPVPDAHLAELIQAIDSWGTRHNVRYSLALKDDAPAEDCCWEIEKLGDGSAAITAYIGSSELEGIVEIPEEIDGCRITALGRKLFYECKKIEEIRLPETITEFGEASFCLCNGLRKVNFPGGLEVIPADCFNECGFERLEIPDTVKIIKRGAFVNNRRLESITIPEGIMAIEMMTFAGCKSLREVSLPSTLREIGDGSFSGCESLGSIGLPEGLESIGMMAFLSCRRLKDVRLPGSLSRLGDLALPSGAVQEE